MILLYIIGAILALVVLVVGAAYANSELYAHKTYGLAGKDVSNYSWPAKQILKAYHALPAGNRPAGDISAMLTALDTEHEVKTVNEHFENRYHRYDDKALYTWNCRCYRPGICTYKEYHEINDAIEEISKALAKQQKAMIVAGISGDLGEAKALAARLKEEREIIDSVTEGLVK